MHQTPTCLCVKCLCVCSASHPAFFNASSKSPQTKNFLVIDSFAGSGTTGHAVLAQNKADGGSRRFILVEMDKEICSNVTAQRLARVSQGYKDIEPLGGGFQYCRIGETLFDSSGQIAETVSFIDLARFVFLKETGLPLPDAISGKSPLIGVHEGVAVYLHYNGVLNDKTATPLPVPRWTLYRPILAQKRYTAQAAVSVSPGWSRNKSPFTRFPTP